MSETYALVARLSQSVGVVFFMSIFIGVVIYALWPKNGDKFASAAELPLKED